MNTCHTWPIGVCTWSLHNDLESINQLMQQLDFNHVHLDLQSVCLEQSDDDLDRIRQQNWTISATMIGFPQEDYSTLQTIRQTGGLVPDDCWPRNRDLAFQAVELTQTLDVQYLSAHIGFIDHSRPADYQKMLDRVQTLADKAREHDVTFLLETGQESADDLKQFLENLNHPALGINFDPANMILYGQGDPVAAVRTLGPWIKHVHIKDALAAPEPDTWGAEVIWGDGDVKTDEFLCMLITAGYNGTLAVEREAGDARRDDIRTAIQHLIQFQK